MVIAVIAVILIIVLATVWNGIPDSKSKDGKNPNFHADSFDKEAWKNYDIHHESDNHVVPEDFLKGKYTNSKKRK